jgi:hypothetical protein
LLADVFGCTGAILCIQFLLPGAQEPERSIIGKGQSRYHLRHAPCMGARLMMMMEGKFGIIIIIIITAALAFTIKQDR